MSNYNGLKRAATYLSPELYEALRRQAFDNNRSVSSELKSLVESTVRAASQPTLTERYVLQHTLSEVARTPGLKWEQYVAGFEGFIKREIHALGWTSDTVLHRLKSDGKVMTDEGDVVVLSDRYEES